MKIYGTDNRLILDVEVDDNSYRYRAIMGDHNLTLYFSLADHVEIPVGAWCEFEGHRYTLVKPENVTLHHRRNYEYTVTFDSTQHYLERYRFRDIFQSGQSFGGSKRLKFSVTGTPLTHLQMLVANLNMRDSGPTTRTDDPQNTTPVWTVGSCIDAVEKAISYNHVSCLEALNQMSEEFDTEWEIIDHVISLRKVEYNKSNPLALAYGKGRGFKTGVTRTTEAELPLDRLYVQGGEKNIDPSAYDNCRELLLPKNQTLQYDGEHFEDEDGFNSTNARTYITDTDGLFIRRTDKIVNSPVEGSLDATECYPKRVGTISSVVVVDADEHFYDFIDTSIPEALNYYDCLIEGETMTVIFQSGMLAGREFEISGYNHELRRFQIKPAELDGYDMPGGVYLPATGDKYAIFNVMLPMAYICDNTTKTGASWDMFREAVRYLFDNEEQKITFTGELDGIWASRDWVNIGGKIRLGGYISFSDSAVQPTIKLVRITGIKDYVNRPHSPEIELSNSTISAGFSSHIGQIEQNEVVMEELHSQALSFTKRRFRDAKDTMKMLEEALLDNFTASISPIAVQTMQLLVGDESLQFKFITSLNDTTEISHSVTYNQTTKQLTSAAGVIMHMTLGIANIQHEHANTEYKKWALDAFTSGVLSDGNISYYLYAKVSKTAQTGEFVLSNIPIALEGVSGYYHLLVGALNKEYDGERSYVDLYGFTEILPGRITTDKIVSSDGNTYFDLINNIISGKMHFISGSSGYNNINDRPDLSHFIKDTDGIIEIWYKTVAPTTNNVPASDWNTTALKEEHIGDLYRYRSNVVVEGETRANDTWYRWEKYSTIRRIDNNDVNVIDYRWAQLMTTPAWFKYIPNASKMFMSVTPQPPYAVGDIWLNGGIFLKCVTAKPNISDLFNDADWDDAKIYDNTQTVIDGGIVTSGTLRLAGDDNHIKAGITGAGTQDTSVRIWAGASEANKTTAPFRVLQSGRVFCENILFMGGGMFPYLIINSSNYLDYGTIYDYDWGGGDVEHIYVLDMKKAGGHFVLDIPNNDPASHKLAFPVDSSLVGSTVEIITGNCEFVAGSYYPPGYEKHNCMAAFDGSYVNFPNKVSYSIFKFRYFKFQCFCYKTSDFPLVSQDATVDNGYFVRWALIENFKLTNEQNNLSES